MSALRPTIKATAAEVAHQPYPCWSAIAGGLGAAAKATEQDCQALKEVRLWRALADEPRAEGQAAAAEQDGSTSPPVRATPDT